MTLSAPHADKGSEKAERDSEKAERDREILELRKEQAERDRRQEEREAKRDKELLELRNEQGERDRRQEERDAKRDKELLELRREQAKLTNVLLNFQEQQSKHHAGFGEVTSRLSPQSGLAQASTTALRSAMQTGSVASSQRDATTQARSEVSTHTGTPQVNVRRPEKYNRDWYCELSRRYGSFCEPVDLPEALGKVSTNWSKAWDSIDNDDALVKSLNAKKILTAYRSKYKDIAAKPNHQNAPETMYQTAFHNLAKAVE
ncbi:hypothetical protein EV175_003962, partial [Coemansia sp. RSA 1933]